MKLLLTSGGITNKTIADALRGLIGKPFDESKLVFVPTAASIEASDKSWLINDLVNCINLKWREIDILDIAATPEEKMWRSRIESADAILFGGGNSFFLMHWLKKSGLEKLLPELLKTRVYIGISAGSIIAARNLSLSSGRRRDLFELFFEEEINSGERAGIEEGLGLADFHVRPHLNSEHFPKMKAEYLGKIAKDLKEPMYAIDDQSAIEVIDDNKRIVSEGQYLTYTL